MLKVCGSPLRLVVFFISPLVLLSTGWMLISISNNKYNAVDILNAVRLSNREPPVDDWQSYKFNLLEGTGDWHTKLVADGAECTLGK